MTPQSPSNQAPWDLTQFSQSPSAAPSYFPRGLLNHPNSFCRGMFKLNAKFHADSLLYSVSHFECVGHTVHMLTHWRLPPPLTSAVKSSFTHAHSSHCPWLPVHINVMQTVLIILTMVGLFPDRPHRSKIIENCCPSSNLPTNVQSSSIHVSQRVEITQTSIYRGLNK